MWWRGKKWREKYRLTRQVVWDGLAAGKEPYAILEDMLVHGADAVGAIQIYVWFRWEWNPWWVRRSTIFGFAQARHQAIHWLLGWALLGVILLLVGLLGLRDPTKEFGIYWPYLLLASFVVTGRVVWRWCAIRWIDQHGSWLFAGLTPWQLRKMAREIPGSTPDPAEKTN